MKRVAPLLLGAAVATAALPARADFETWVWTEIRAPLIQTEKPTFPRLDWRFFTDTRMSVRAGGLYQAFLRTGPLFYVSSWLFIAVHGTIYADKLARPVADTDIEAGDFAQEARVEVEPNFFWRLGDFTFNDRNRYEYRIRSYETRHRYRNQLRINYAPKGAKWIPFVWDEVLVDLSGNGVHQNRFEIGIGRMLTDQVRVDLGFMARSRKDAGVWSHDGIFNVYVFVDAPAKKKEAPKGAR